MVDNAEPMHMPAKVIMRLPIFQRGCLDRCNNNPYPREYETAPCGLQHMYELGRYFASYLLDIGRDPTNIQLSDAETLLRQGVREGYYR